jgi:autoinducer 2-degrading protein
MYALCVSLKVKPDQRDAFLAAAEDDSICSVRDEPGCVRFDVLADQDDPNHFLFYEVYKDEDAFKAHQQGAHFVRWRAAAAEVLAESPTRTLSTIVFPRAYQ